MDACGFFTWIEQDLSVNSYPKAGTRWIILHWNYLGQAHPGLSQHLLATQ